MNSTTHFQSRPVKCGFDIARDLLLLFEAVNRILKIAIGLLFFVFFTASSAHAQRGVRTSRKPATEMSASRPAVPGPPVRLGIERGPSVTGPLTKISNTETLFELFNPMAPQSAGKAEDNMPATPIDKKRPGFRGLIFLKFSW
ncbi:MAG: hypothetical protein ACI8QF_000818 [Limisphaerales bacterium]